MATGNAVLEDWQWRAVMMLLLPGLGFIGVAAFVTPAGAGYWLGIAIALLGGVILGGVAGGMLARAIEGWMRPPAATQPLLLSTPDALPADERARLQAAVLPVLLTSLAAAAKRMPAREKAAALALVEAGATAPEGEARQALAQALPRLIGTLAGGSGAPEAEALAQRLAQGGRP